MPWTRGGRCVIYSPCPPYPQVVSVFIFVALMDKNLLCHRQYDSLVCVQQFPMYSMVNVLV